MICNNSPNCTVGADVSDVYKHSTLCPCSNGYLESSECLEDCFKDFFNKIINDLKKELFENQ